MRYWGGKIIAVLEDSIDVRMEHVRSRKKHCLKANIIIKSRPKNPARIIPVSEFVSIGWRFLGVKKYLVGYNSLL